ncbi:hypothetical protein TrRE_jg8151, partial [Triparma retinervis]
MNRSKASMNKVQSKLHKLEKAMDHELEV